MYVIRSHKDSDLYIGVTTNVSKRLAMHNSGTERATKGRIPFVLIYCEVFTNKIDAYSREKYLKSGWGRKHFKHALKYMPLENS